MKPETLSHVAGQFSWVPLTYHSLPWVPLPTKSLALSARVSPLMIHFLVLDKSLILALEGVPPFLQQFHHD